MFNRFVCNAKLPKVMADHLGLDFHLVEGLAIVNSNDASDHFWDNDHVSQVRFHYLRYKNDKMRTEQYQINIYISIICGL